MKNKIKNYEQSHPEAHLAGHIIKLNWLRAAVLGANDGIVSVAGIVLGVAGATTSRGAILTAGLAGIIAGAISMAAGEYVSVSSSRDTERALLEKERYELKHYPQEELEELANIYEKKGLSRKTAMTVASELTDRNPEAAHFDAELHIDPDNLTNPWHAAFASAISFLLGAIIPLLAITFPSESLRVPITFISVLVALIITGVASAMIGQANILKATVRVVVGGAVAMVVTYSIGRMLKTHGI